MLAIWNPTTVVNLWFSLQPPSRKFMFITFHKRPQTAATHNLIPRWQSQVPLRFGFHSAYRGFLKWKGFCRFCILSHSFWGPNLGTPFFLGGSCCWQKLPRHTSETHIIMIQKLWEPGLVCLSHWDFGARDKAILVSEDHCWMTIATGCPTGHLMSTCQVSNGCQDRVRMKNRFIRVTIWPQLETLSPKMGEEIHRPRNSGLHRNLKNVICFGPLAFLPILNAYFPSLFFGSMFLSLSHLTLGRWS